MTTTTSRLHNSRTMVFRRVDTAKPSFKRRHRASSVHVAHAASRFESTWNFAFRSVSRTSRRRRRGDARSDGHHRSSRGRVLHRTASSSSGVGVDGVAAVRRRRIQRNVIWIKIPKIIIGHLSRNKRYMKGSMFCFSVKKIQLDDVIHVSV